MSIVNVLQDGTDAKVEKKSVKKVKVRNCALQIMFSNNLYECDVGRREQD